MEQEEVINTEGITVNVSERGKGVGVERGELIGRGDSKKMHTL